MEEKYEPNMNTLAAIAKLSEPEYLDRLMGIVRVFGRDNFRSWLKIFCVDEGIMSLKNAVAAVDWDFVVDHFYLIYLQSLDKHERIDA